jgi:hypothetical protein
MAVSMSDEGRRVVAFEVVEFCEPSPEPGRPFPGTAQEVIGTFDDEVDAIRLGRSRWQEMRATDTTEVMWWIVRVPGETLARWIADRSSPDEQVLDLTTNELVVVRD